MASEVTLRDGTTNNTPSQTAVTDALSYSLPLSRASSSETPSLLNVTDTRMLARRSAVRSRSSEGSSARSTSEVPI
ncbi:MAG: hypothetical protein M3Q98_12580 [Actinomycetota bacterium]|nr:hypothetical protein [Actinomycetota bacterium]